MRNTSLKKIYREGIDGYHFYGMVLDESSDFLLIAKEYDFQIDGYSILRKSDITYSVSNKSTKYCFKILKAEKLLQSIQPQHIDLTNWQTIFKSLGKGKFITVEDEIEGDFSIGPIVRINKKSIVLDYFDGTGKWRGEEKSEYSNITSVDFDTNYINMHEKYITPNVIE